MAVASGARFYFISIIGEKVLTDLRRAVFDHLLTLDATFFDTHRVGELTSRLNGDVATIRGAIGSSLSMVLRGIVTITGAVVLMFLTSPYLALAVVVIAPGAGDSGHPLRAPPAASVAPHAGRAGRHVGDGHRDAERHQDGEELRAGRRAVAPTRRSDESLNAEVTGSGRAAG
jgi:ABC-type multidrug transport system fused ATPase/permease subunit